jgi:hypothetical protein
MRKLTPLLFLFVAFACKKEGGNRVEEISGILLHSKTGAPIPGQELLMQTLTSKTVNDDPIEFPGGYPVFSINEYVTTTDAHGKFSFRAVSSKGWTFSIVTRGGEYSQIDSMKQGGIAVVADPDMATMLRKKYDTIYAERSAVIKYIINNTGQQYYDDSLFVSTPLGRTLRWPANTIRLSNEFNWLFVGLNNMQPIVDTIPGERYPVVEVKWKYSRQGVVISKQEQVSVTPGTTTDYTIEY